VGSGLVVIIVGAVIGWALSLTQGSHPSRWPWVLVGAVAGAGLFLWVWHLSIRRRHPPGQTPGIDAPGTHETVTRTGDVERGERRTLERWLTVLARTAHVKVGAPPGKVDPGP
jgi:hypothetical protein